MSVPGNLAEEAAEYGQRAFSRFLGAPGGPLIKPETPLLMVAELGYLAHDDPVLEKLEEVSRLSAGLHNRLKRTS